MSASPQTDKYEDELEEIQHGHDATEGPGAPDTVDGQTPAKRGRGRPKGSKNKKQGISMSSLSVAAPSAGTSADTPKKKRGRPPKEKKPDDSGGETEPTPKRKRGRPPKNPKPDTTDGEGGASGDGAESSTKKKRGRPPKKI